MFNGDILIRGDRLNPGDTLMGASDGSALASYLTRIFCCSFWISDDEREDSYCRIWCLDLSVINYSKSLNNRLSFRSHGRTIVRLNLSAWPWGVPGKARRLVQAFCTVGSYQVLSSHHKNRFGLKRGDEHRAFRSWEPSCRFLDTELFRVGTYMTAPTLR
jgi:hypothetical protein